MSSPCVGRIGPVFCGPNGPIPVDPYPTTDGSYYAVVVIQDGEPTSVVWANAEGGSESVVPGESMFSRFARWLSRRFGY